MDEKQPAIAFFRPSAGSMDCDGMSSLRLRALNVRAVKGKSRHVGSPAVQSPPRIAFRWAG
jgi:hypothetical protein